jgi:hypothetical protein
MNDREVELSKSMDLDEVYIDEYWSTYRKHIHTLLAWGYADSRNKVQIEHDEPAITGFIAEAIQDRLDAFDSPLWCNQIVIKDDPPISGGGRTGRRRWRPDLIFESVERRPRPKYHFEAKRLRKRQSIDEYLGEDGLQCFLSGKYALESTEAGMLGYIQCDDINIWMERLKLVLDQDYQGKNEFLLLPPHRNIQVIDAFPQEWMSNHDRHIGKNIVIHHLLLDYCITASVSPRSQDFSISPDSKSQKMKGDC